MAAERCLGNMHQEILISESIALTQPVGECFSPSLSDKDSRIALGMQPARPLSMTHALYALAWGRSA